MPAFRSVAAVSVAALSIAASIATWIAPAAAAEPSAYSPATAAIDTTCNADRAKASAADVVRMVRFAAAGDTLGAWRSASDADVSRLAAQTDFAAGELATIVFDRSAVVSADVAHSDSAAASVVTRAWCFIGGKLARATADVTFIVRGDGYRRTRYYGDDLGQPLGETMLEKSPMLEKLPRGKAFVAPSKDVDAMIAIDPIARPIDLPFYAAAESARAYRPKP
jgi:hypothetical protein